MRWQPAIGVGINLMMGAQSRIGPEDGQRLSDGPARH
jgi:hypothetical protein